MSQSDIYKELQPKVQLLTAGELLELLLQGDGGVVGAKYLCSQAVHQLLQVLIENRSLQERQREKRVQQPEMLTVETV